MRIGEILTSLVITALIRSLIGLVPAILLTSPLFGISILDLGIFLFFLFLSLYIFGITLGILVSSGLLRFGPSFENIAWSTMFLLAPFGCIYYPIETLPEEFLWDNKYIQRVRAKTLSTMLYFQMKDQI